MEERYLSDVQVGARFGVSRSTAWRWLRLQTMEFTKPVQLSPGCTRWKLSELIAWEERKLPRGKL